jgi:polysaccharide export outer membrane protein
MRKSSLIFTLASVAILVAVAHGQEAYRVGPRDILVVTVWGHAEMSGRYTVAEDGTFPFPMTGPAKAAGLTTSEIELGLVQSLSNGFLKNPHVTVAVAEYLSQQLFVMGEVGKPGEIPLTGPITLLEALARAGSLTERAAGEVVLLRASSGPARSGPLVRGQPGVSEVTRVSVQQIRSGSLTANVELHNGDTLFVPRAETIFVLGMVATPGTYMLEPGMTVLKAISTAGGTNQLGSTRRIHIVRVVEGRQTEIKAKMDDVLKPGDTVVVGTRIF